MELESKLLAVGREVEEIKEALCGRGSYLGLSLQVVNPLKDVSPSSPPASGKSMGKDEHASTRKELRQHLHAQQEKESILLRLQLATLSARAVRGMSPEGKQPQPQQQPRQQEEEDEVFSNLQSVPSVTSLKLNGRRRSSTSSNVIAVVDTLSRDKVLGIQGVRGCLLSYVGANNYAFVSRVCQAWRDAYIEAYPARTSYKSVLESTQRMYWARCNGIDFFQPKIFRAAVRFYDLETCKIVYNMGCPWNHGTHLVAATRPKGGLVLLKWLRSLTPWDGEPTWVEPQTDKQRDHFVTSAAAFRGDLAMLRFLWGEAAAPEKAERWSASVCEQAVAGGHLKVLQWLRSDEVRCPWDASACPVEQREEWLHQAGAGEGGGEGFPLSDAQVNTIKDWVHANGHPCRCSTE